MKPWEEAAQAQLKPWEQAAQQSAAPAAPAGAQAPVLGGMAEGGFSLDDLADWFNKSSGNPAFEQALQGATFGFSDELQGVMAAAYDAVRGKDFGDSYDARVGAIREGMKAWAEENPTSSLGLNIAGGLGTGAAALQGVRAAGVPVQGMRGVLATGATLGGVAGGGTAEGGPGERVAGAAEGAATGLVLGGAIASAPATVKGIYNKLAPKVRDRLATLAEHSGMTPEQIWTRVRAMGPKATLADTSAAFMDAADAAATRLGPASRKIQEFIRRKEKTATRLMEPIRRTLGDQGQAFRTVDQLQDIRRTMSSPLYEQAYAQGIPSSPKLSRWLQTNPTIKRAWSRVQELGKSDPSYDPRGMMPAGAEPTKIEPSLRGWHRIQRQLRETAERHARAGDNEAANVMRRLRNELLNEMETLSSPTGNRADSPYYQARQLWAGTKIADDAMEMAQKFETMRYSQLVREMRDMSESEREFFRLGVADQIEHVLTRMRDGRDSAGRFKTEDFRRKIRLIMPDADSATDFINTIEAEATKHAVSTAVGQNSRTATRQVASKQLSGEAPMQGDVPMSAQGWIGRVLSDAMGGWGRPREATVQEIGQLLLSQDPATQMKAISLMSMPGRLPPLLRMGELGAGGTAGGSVFLTSP